MAVLLASCGGPRMDVGQMTAARPVDLKSVQTVATPPAQYRIGVGRQAGRGVLQVADLSFEELVVDASGNIDMPLIGAVRGAGRPWRDVARASHPEVLGDDVIVVDTSRLSSVLWEAWASVRPWRSSGRSKPRPP